ncbi:MAG: hypothetical protein NTZ74_00075 [Chloroflexi bacterium]|nr:hypothetical protein [Chloroflexota bacterium]
MKNSKIILSGTPPRILPTLLKGFNTIANHAYLILFPIGVDLLLWLGPKLRLKNLIQPFVNQFSSDMVKISPPELLDSVKASQTIWEQLLTQFNLATSVRTFPVGIPSIMARQSPIDSPLGSDWIYEVPNFRLALLILIGLLLVGFFLGSIYFYLISRVTSSEVEEFSNEKLFLVFIQSLLMFCLLVAAILIISIPLMLLLSVLSLINIGIGQVFLLVVAFAFIWLVMPLVFSPHGVFVLKQKALPSMLISIRLVRLFLPGTGLFVMTCALISEGLNTLWTMPGSTSWLTLFGIGGHAFIVTGLLAASFIYYREGLKWMQDNLQRIADATKEKQENGGTTLGQQ